MILPPAALLGVGARTFGEARFPAMTARTARKPGQIPKKRVKVRSDLDPLDTKRLLCAANRTGMPSS